MDSFSFIRYYELLGETIMENELQKLDEKIIKSCPKDVLTIDGLLLGRNSSKPVIEQVT